MVQRLQIARKDACGLEKWRENDPKMSRNSEIAKNGILERIDITETEISPQLSF